MDAGPALGSRTLASPGAPGGGKRLLAPGTKCRVGASAVPGGRIVHSPDKSPQAGQGGMSEGAPLTDKIFLTTFYSIMAPCLLSVTENP